MTRKLLHQRLKELRVLSCLAFRRPSKSGKVFCIGYLKTGSTSVGMALRELGYRHASFNSYAWRNYQNKRIDRLLWFAERFDAFDDLPWFREDLVPMLEDAFPGCKFIDLVRDEASWSRSMQNWSKAMFGKALDAEKELAAFRRHKAFVKEYFGSHPSDTFISLDVSDPRGFEKMAGFLGRTAPRSSFPHHNKSS